MNIYKNKDIFLSKKIQLLNWKLKIFFFHLISEFLIRIIFLSPLFPLVYAFYKDNTNK